MLQLNPIDTAMLMLESARTPFHVSMINIYDRSTCPGKPPAFDDIVEAVRISLPTAPSFRRKLIRVPLDLDYPYWIEDEDFELDFHMRHTALPKPGNWDQFRKHVSRLISRPLDLSRPPWEMTVVDSLDSIAGLPANCFATVLKIHHSAIDGQTGVSMVNALHQDRADKKPKRIVDSWQPEPVPSNRELMKRAWVNSMVHPLSIARLLVSNAGALVRAGFNDLRSDDGDDTEMAPATKFNGAVSAHKIFDEARCALDDIKRVRKTVEGATVNDVCITVVAECMRRYLLAKGELPEESLITAMPISTRTPEQTRRGGNQITITRVSLHTDIVDPIERLAAITKETQKKKAVQDGVVMKVLLNVVHSLPGALVGAVGRVVPLAMASSSSATRVPFNTLVTNVPGPTEPLYFLGARAVRMLGGPPITDGGGLLHGVGSYNGESLFGFTACRDLLPDVDFYRECLQSAIQAVIETADKRTA